MYSRVICFGELFVNIFAPHHDVGNGVQEPLHPGVVAGLHPQLPAMTFPQHLLQASQVSVVYPYPNVGPRDHQACQHNVNKVNYRFLFCVYTPCCVSLKV
jgi:hypothetical protein